MRHGDESGAFAEERLEVGDVEQAVVGIDPPLLDLAADSLGGAPDGTGVGLVILVGDDHLVARFEHVGEGMGEHVGVRRGRRPEHDLAGLDAERFGPTLAGSVHQLAGAARRLELAVGLHLEVGVVLGERVDRLTAGK